ncbi:arsenate reductase (glutaredoxin) [Rhodobium gokarnense]|uniref:Arsenate reductase n=1 Tax=Rhodobium gokarnense TaxID=364296 RepID=A0ABT3H9L4_9HYPH|nr:arsenate reductase (glutaredoxin) [Rhodobium gokarnense]MCW2307093.1 arsenate reductase [Rhodobium gokarnense]
MTVTIWHNPRCSKSREALQLLRDNGVEPEIVEYLKTPPSEAEIKAVLDKLGIDARALMRTKEKSYKELGLAGVTDDDKLVAAMAENPVLIERPVVLKGEKAALGRPPEDVLKIL